MRVFGLDYLVLTVISGVRRLGDVCSDILSLYIRELLIIDTSILTPQVLDDVSTSLDPVADQVDVPCSSGRAFDIGDPQELVKSLSVFSC